MKNPLKDIDQKPKIQFKQHKMLQLFVFKVVDVPYIIQTELLSDQLNQFEKKSQIENDKKNHFCFGCKYIIYIEPTYMIKAKLHFVK